VRKQSVTDDEAHEQLKVFNIRMGYTMVCYMARTETHFKCTVIIGVCVGCSMQFPSSAVTGSASYDRGEQTHEQ
jgi:hypothetical protein